MRVLRTGTGRNPHQRRRARKDIRTHRLFGGGEINYKYIFLASVGAGSLVWSVFHRAERMFWGAMAKAQWRPMQMKAEGAWAGQNVSMIGMPLR